MFLMPLLLSASALAIIPLIVHLLHRQNTTPLQWGAMQFLLETPVSMRRRQRIDHWLLMLVRMAILLCLVALLARPLIHQAGVASAPPMDVAIVIDHSLSMGRRSANAVPDAPAATLYQAAVADADTIARMLPSSATLSIVLAEHTPRALTEAPIPVRASLTGGPGSSWTAILQQLRKLKPGTTDANIPEALRTAAELVSHGKNFRKMILVCSDDQRTNWQPGNDSGWRLALGDRDPNSPTPAIPIYALPLAVGNTPNASLSAMSFQPSFLAVHRPSVISATLANTGAGPMPALPLRLLVDGRIVARQVSTPLAPGQSTTLHFDYDFPDPGSHWARVEADANDGLDADNAVTAAVNISPRLRVLVVDGALTPAAEYPAAGYLAAAMQPVDPAIDPTATVIPKIISISQLPAERLADYAVVVLNDVPRVSDTDLARLVDYTRAGNGLWFILGPRTQPTFLAGPLAHSPLLPGVTVGNKFATTPDDKPAFLDVKEPDNAALQVITAAQQNAFANVGFRAWWPLRLPAPAADSPRATLAITAGDPTPPFATDMDLGSNGGRVVFWTSPLNGSWNYLNTAPQVVPLVQETLFHLASGSGGSGGGQLRRADAGDTLLWSGPVTPAVDSATLLLPDATSKPLHVQLRGDKYITSFNDTYLPGLYELHFTPASVPQPVFFSVNIDRAELDFTSLTAADVKWLTDHNYVKDRVTTDTLPQAMEATAGGIELWAPLAVILVALLLFEVLITRTLAKNAELPPDRAALLAASSGASAATEAAT